MLRSLLSMLRKVRGRTLRHRARGLTRRLSRGISTYLPRLFVVFRFPIAVVLRAFRVRFLVNSPWPESFSRVGHLAIEVDCFLKEERVGLRPHYRAAIVCPANLAANRCLLKNFGRHERVISSPWLCRL